ncbi:hypothetical protein [Paracoccus alkenifer]|uniref:Uncharacterized protein n=1 Tax=Paracoccus alkenifer TaxID=65735 RepID=A0A1H6KFK8_9RHOB|nr:hypothetical protein [Paracoccus alkenifer]SEH71454.1 hypothetical protein SAMN04488075_0940 [Paracoccus alkenifer]
MVATVRAPGSLCEVFARHQLARGASRVFLFHDDPDMAPEIALPGVTNTICDAGWWRRGRPEALARDGEDGLDALYLRMAVMPPDLLAQSLAAGFVQLIPPEPHLAADPAAQ